ncbi:MAG: hypothetical protein BWX71_02008 [Deltaproteobacteria bacterium ADurb.Bin072]|nr:MAG: hypothetical protein BWX71_02008 [Deltaproteobacteria bacterium ADurb.Bin072]
MLGKGLVVVFRFGDHDTVHHDPGHLHLACIQRAPFRDSLHLGDHEAPGVFSCRRYGVGLDGERLLFHGHVAVRVRRRAPDDAHIDREGHVGEVVLAVEVDKLHEVIFCPRVDLSSVQPGIDIGPKAYGGDGARLVCRNVPEHVRNHALGEIVGLDPVLNRHFPELRCKAPVTADHALHETLVGEVVEPPVLSVTLACRIDNGEVPWPAGLDEVLLDLQKYLLGNTDPHETTGCDGISVLYDPHGLFCRDDLAPDHPQRGQGRKHGVDTRFLGHIFSLLVSLVRAFEHEESMKNSAQPAIISLPRRTGTAWVTLHRR